MADLPPQQSDAQQDPISTRSLSLPLLIASLLMMLALIWALYDEAYGTRPWKAYQKNFKKLYVAYLQKAIPAAAEQEKQVKQAPEYVKLSQDIDAAEKAVASQVAEIDRHIAQDLNPRITVLTKVFSEQRGKVSALTYQWETASPGSKPGIQREIDAAKDEIIRVSLPATSTEPAGRKEFKYAQLEEELNRLKAEKAELQTKRIALLQPAT